MKNNLMMTALTALVLTAALASCGKTSAPEPTVVSGEAARTCNTVEVDAQGRPICPPRVSSASTSSSW